MAYYYAGCASWTWYYPYFYAPLASDLITVPEGTAAPFALGASSRERAALHCMCPCPLVGLNLLHQFETLLDNSQQESLYADCCVFDAGRPFRPLEQLLAVLPPASAAAAGLPPSLQSLMTDAASPIVQYYPEVTNDLACTVPFLLFCHRRLQLDETFVHLSIFGCQPCYRECA